MTLIELLGLLRKHLRLVIILPLICALATAAYSWIILPNTYTSSVSIYVLARNNTADNTSNLSNELSASQMITNDVASLVNSTRVLSQTAEELGLENLDDYSINVNSATNTRVITIAVTGTAPVRVASVANQLASVTNQVAQEVMDVESVNVLDEAVAPTSPSGPPRTLYTLVALLAGFFIAIAIVVLIDTLNTKVRGPEEIEQLLDVPVIGRIPLIKK